jgi:Integrase core domain
MGHPPSRPGSGRDGGSVQPSPPQPPPDPGAGGAKDRAPTLDPTTWAGPDRPPGRAGSLHGACGLVRCRISRLAHLERASGQPIRRYEHDHPGQLVQIDVKKLGNIAAGGGHRFLGRATGARNRQADRSSGRTSRHRNPLQGHGFIHAAVDDHSRLAYAEIHPDERRETAAGFLTRARAWFADHGVVISGC